MDRDLQCVVETAIEEATIGKAGGEPARIVSQQAASGGCIHDARTVELADGRRFFVKARRDTTSMPGVFAREAEGLRALADAATLDDALRVPEVIAVVDAPTSAPSALVLEAIDIGSPGAGFFETFGRGFAALHRATSPDGRIGFARDNYLGATPQPNGWKDEWVDFWREHRLGHQLRLARANGVSDPTLDRLGDRLLERLDDYLGPVDEPSLLHGDLWGGNYLADAAGRPVLIDPAAYYGHREADLAMTRLFGGFESAFYRAYEEAWPLTPGARERGAIYELHHMLNHLNLFGGGYRSGCLERLRRLV